MDVLFRVAGAIISVILAAGAAVLAVFTPQWWVVAATLAANLFLFYFAQITMDRRWAWRVPAAVWAVIVVFAVLPTTEGDMIASSWVGLATFAAGTLGFLLPAASHRPTRRTLALPRR